MPQRKIISKHYYSLTSFHRSVGLSNVPSHGSQESNTVLGGGDGVSRGRVDYQATVLGGRRQIHIVDPDAGSSNHLEPPSGRFKHLAANLRSAPNDDRITERDLGAELFGTEIVRAIHVSELFEKLQPSLAELLRNQNSRLRVQRARSFNDHHQGLRESPAGTESYGESRAEWLSRRERQRRRFEKWSCSESLRCWRGHFPVAAGV